jgi:hypothetical protein
VYPAQVVSSLSRLWIGLLVALFGLAGCAGEIVMLADDDDVADDDDTGDDDSDEAIWQAFLDAREEYLVALAEPIAACVSAYDTYNPVFHGCVDWHSAVHGTWSLLAISRITGDPYYAEIAEAQLTEAMVAGELVQLEDGGWLAASEIPYGYAWFLTLARERQAGGVEDLVPLADVVAADLEDHLFGLSSGELGGNLLSDSYSNLSWEALNLWMQAQYVEDDVLADDLATFVRDEVVPRAHECPLEAEAYQLGEFFPACLHEARLVLETLPADEVEAWLEANEPDDFELDPLVEPTTTHSAGLNFSRSWGLYALYEATGDARYRTLYVRHIETHMAMPQYWADSYWSYSHWVAQFGVYGIALSYE